MGTITLNDKTLHEVDEKLDQHRFNTRVEFVEDAVKRRLSELEKKEVLKNLEKVYGASKRRTTDEDLHKVRERLVEEYEKKFS